MASGRWRAVLVVGGIGSGRSAYAETLLAGNGSRRLTAGPGDELADLARTLAEAKPDEALLVDDLSQWLPPAARGGPAAPDEQATDALAAAVRDCPARLVIVSPEVGLSWPTTAAGKSLAEAVGAVNVAVAAATDAVALVVAGQPTWLKGALAASGPVPAVPANPPPEGGQVGPDPSDLRALPQPDEQAQEAATERLTGAGLGALAAVAGFAAGTQGTLAPSPWRAVRMLVLHGDHAGAAAAGATGSAQRATDLREGTGALAELASGAGAQLHLVAATSAAAIEHGPAMTDDAAEAGLAHGWHLAERAVDDGADVLALGSIGDGAETAAAAVAAALGGTGSEPAALLGRVRASDGTIDDAAWIQRCAAVRDAVHRAKSASRLAGRAVLAELGGADLAIAVGVLLGAAARRTPVLIDGPLGAAAALVARNLAAPARHWCLLPDHGGHPTVVRVSEVLGLTPVLDLALDLGEGAATLAALPLLRSALVLAHPPARVQQQGTPVEVG